jgi:hypothetical protein
MTRPRLLRLLRIAFSAVCGIVCLLLIGLWVRSSNYIDRVTWHYSKPRAIQITTTPGRILSYKFVDQPILVPGNMGRKGSVKWEEPLKSMRHFNAGPMLWSFGSVSGKDFAGVYVPFWVLVVLATVLAIAPWLKWFRRFSLRTLLLATTLVAVVLGLAVAFR